MSEKNFFFYSKAQLPTCCGALEAGDFHIGTTGEYYHGGPVDLEDTLVKTIQEERPVFLNFVQYKNEETDEYEDEYDCQEVLDILLADASGVVVDLGTWINCNSDNRIHGIMIKGTAHE